MQQLAAKLCVQHGTREVNDLIFRAAIGLIAIVIAFLPAYLAWLPNHETPTSISATYFANDHSRNFFVGLLFGIAALLLAYNGRTRCQLVAAKIAALAAVGVAMFPCACPPFGAECNGTQSQLPGLHYVCAMVMYVVQLYFCVVFYQRARHKGHVRAIRRSYIYAICMGAMSVALVMLAANAILCGAFVQKCHQFVLIFEMTGLLAFGLSWMSASHVLPFTAEPDERPRFW